MASLQELLAESSKLFSTTLPSRQEIEDEIESVSLELGVDPTIMKGLAQQESNFNSEAVSSAGAQGVMQLMPATAKELGVTDSFDFKQNIHGGVKFFKQQLDTFNDVELALAAYNAGPGNVQKHGGIPPFKETQDYVPKVLKKSKNFNVSLNSLLILSKDLFAEEGIAPTQPPTEEAPAPEQPPQVFEGIGEAIEAAKIAQPALGDSAFREAVATGQQAELAPIPGEPTKEEREATEAQALVQKQDREIKGEEFLRKIAEDSDEIKILRTEVQKRAKEGVGSAVNIAEEVLKENPDLLTAGTTPEEFVHQQRGVEMSLLAKFGALESKAVDFGPSGFLARLVTGESVEEEIGRRIEETEQNLDTRQQLIDLKAKKDGGEELTPEETEFVQGQKFWPQLKQLGEILLEQPGEAAKAIGAQIIRDGPLYLVSVGGTTKLIKTIASLKKLKGAVKFKKLKAGAVSLLDESVTVFSVDGPKTIATGQEFGLEDALVEIGIGGALAGGKALFGKKGLPGKIEEPKVKAEEPALKPEEAELEKIEEILGGNVSENVVKDVKTVSTQAPGRTKIDLSKKQRKSIRVTLSDLAERFKKKDPKLTNEQALDFADIGGRHQITDLPSTAHLNTFLDDIRKSPEKEKNLISASLDLQAFKRLNDTFGQEDGDLIMLDIQTKLNDLAEDNGIKHFHIGGDEAIIVANVSDAEKVFKAMTEIKDRIKKMRVSKGDKKGPIGINIALSEGTPDLADQVLKKVKKEGGKNFLAFDPGLKKKYPNLTDRFDEDVNIAYDKAGFAKGREDGGQRKSQSVIGRKTGPGDIKPPPKLEKAQPKEPPKGPKPTDGSPPVDEHLTTVLGGEGGVKRFRTEDLNKSRVAMGLDKLSSPQKKSDIKAQKQAFAEKVPERAKDIAIDFKAKEARGESRALSDVEVQGFKIAIENIENQFVALADDLNKTSDKGVQADITAKMQRLQDEHDLLTEVDISTGTETARALQARKAGLGENYKLITIRTRAKMSKKTDLTPKESAALEQLVKKIDTIDARLEKLGKVGTEKDVTNLLNKHRKSRTIKNLDLDELYKETEDLLKAGCINA